MNNKSIGIFDSGLGGLTVLRAVHELMPKENLIYFGDSGRAPYGTKSKETIIKYTFQDIELLLAHDVKMIVIACNTASACAIEAVREFYKIPIVEVIEPGAMAAAKVTKSGRIGIIGTPATVSSGVYEKNLKKILPDCTCVSIACPMFVPLVEEGLWDGEIAEKIVEHYLSEIKSFNVDSLVLGCTHYPLIAPVIGAFMGENITMVNSALEVARAVQNTLIDNDLIGDNDGMMEFFTSDSVQKFKSLGELFLGEPLESVNVMKSEG